MVFPELNLFEADHSIGVVPVDPGHVKHLGKVVLQLQSCAIRAGGPVIRFHIAFIEKAFNPVNVADVLIDLIVAVFKIHIADNEHEAGDAQCQPEDVDE